MDAHKQCKTASMCQFASVSIEQLRKKKKKLEISFFMLFGCRRIARVQRKRGMSSSPTNGGVKSWLQLSKRAITGRYARDGVARERRVRPAWRMFAAAGSIGGVGETCTMGGENEGESGGDSGATLLATSVCAAVSAGG